MIRLHRITAQSRPFRLLTKAYSPSEARFEGSDTDGCSSEWRLDERREAGKQARYRFHQARLWLELAVELGDVESSYLLGVGLKALREQEDEKEIEEAKNRDEVIAR